MRKNLVVLAVLLLSSVSSFAQYDVVLEVQDTMEQRIYSNNRVKMERVIWQSDTGLVLHKGRAFNTKGQMVLSREYYSRMYLNYRPDGKLLNYLDSAYSDTSYDVIRYNFTYDNLGRVIQLSTGDGMSSIEYTPDGRKGVETFITHDRDTSNRHYYYDAGRKLIRSDFFDSDGKLYFVERNKYDADGKLDVRQRVKYLENNGLDSTITNYIYKNGRLSEVRAHVTKLYYISQSGGEAPTHSALQEFTEVTKYFYNSDGLLLGREYNHNKNEMAYTYFSWTYDERGLPIKHSEKFGTSEPLFFIHDYVYY